MPGFELSGIVLNTSGFPDLCYPVSCQKHPDFKLSGMMSENSGFPDIRIWALRYNVRNFRISGFEPSGLVSFLLSFYFSNLLLFFSFIYSLFYFYFYLFLLVYYYSKTKDEGRNKKKTLHTFPSTGRYWWTLFVCFETSVQNLQRMTSWAMQGRRYSQRIGVMHFQRLRIRTK